MKSHENDAGLEDPDDKTNTQEDGDADYSKVFFAPYHPHARKMFKVLKKSFNINCVHKKTTTLGNLLFKRRPKPDIWGTTHVVYSIPTNDQKLQYIGHTKRKLRKRVQEHENSCKGDLSNFQPNDVQDSGIPFHYASTGENFKFEETKILEREKNNLKRKILESIHISNKIDSLVNLK